MDVYRLLSDELKYELIIRQQAIGNTVEEKRRTLREAIPANCEIILPNLDPEIEIHICANKLDELCGAIQEFEGKNDYLRIRSRLLYVGERIKRINPSSDVGAQKCSELQKLSRELFRTLEEIYSGTLRGQLSQGQQIGEQSLIDLGDDQACAAANNIEHQSTPSGPDRREGLALEERNVGSDYHQVLLTSTRRVADRLGELSVVENRSRINNVIPSVSSAAKIIPVNKWNIKFNGEVSVTLFLERVEELRISRVFSKHQLLQ